MARAGRLIALGEAASLMDAELRPRRERAHRNLRAAFAVIADRLDEGGLLRVSPRKAADTLYAIANESTYLRMTEGAGLAPGAYAGWLVGRDRVGDLHVVLLRWPGLAGEDHADDAALAVEQRAAGVAVLDLGASSMTRARRRRSPGQLVAVEVPDDACRGRGSARRRAGSRRRSPCRRASGRRRASATCGRPVRDLRDRRCRRGGRCAPRRRRRRSRCRPRC